MIKDLPLKSKFEYLGPVFSKILQDIKRDVRNEHMKQDREFVQKYFSKSYVEKVSSSEIDKAYFNEIVAQNNEKLADWVISKWIMKHAEVYELFVTELSKINQNFEEIELIDVNVAKSIVTKSVDLFGIEDTYIFSLLNSVAFSDEMFEFLKNEVLKNRSKEDGLELKEKSVDVATLVLQHQQEILKLTDRYEKRLQATVKKYSQDVEGLRKQVGILQKKLCEIK
jgi:hypothetical protein